MSSSHFPSKLILSSLLSFLCFTNPSLSYRPMYTNTFSNPTFIGSIKVTDTELNQICSQTEDPSFYLDAFKHDHQTPKANFNQLCTIGLRLATFVSSNAQTQAKSYAQNEKVPQRKEKYNDATQCSKLFGANSVVGEESRQSETLAQAVVAIANKLLHICRK